jgi:hypothetical protein
LASGDIPARIADSLVGGLDAISIRKSIRTQLPASAGSEKGTTHEVVEDDVDNVDSDAELDTWPVAGLVSQFFLTTTAQATGSTALANSTSMPSPVVLARPL